MFRRFRERFGTAGLVVGVIALVLAVGGTALAASGALTSKQKKEVEKIAKKFQGTGPAGAQGPTGPAGANGKDGANGTNGTNGKDGTSVTSEEFSGTKEGKCAGQGGSKFTSASGSSFACNGKEGKAGEPWSAVLASGKTERGVWTLPFQSGGVSEKVTSFAAINFPVPLESKIGGTHLHYINPAGKEVIFNAAAPGFTEEVTSTTCLGSASAPSATKGELCVYAGFALGASSLDAAFVAPETGQGNFPVGSASTSLTGAVISFETPAATQAKAMGTWAVTAP